MDLPRVSVPVHPRACGEQLRIGSRASLNGGSSPRLRGTASSAEASRCQRRFIPAPAGNRSCVFVKQFSRPVHPRACGEQNPSECNPLPRTGSSPRLRGTAPHGPFKRFGIRFIPAPAGNRIDRMTRAYLQAVHPRACGEQNAHQRASNTDVGSSPRLRGTVSFSRLRCLYGRFIPAPAGNRGWIPRILGFPSVHPRACGEQSGTMEFPTITFGSSPRLRGTEVRVHVWAVGIRFIPAPAGNSTHRPGRSLPGSVHPRACGEQSWSAPMRITARGSSPRLRGTD